ncbi:serine/threonine protein kinase [Coemansia sp. Benny D160-2]|nr:serine/threonine protein kinase [Coemansia sp. Benny D160-2]
MSFEENDTSSSNMSSAAETREPPRIPPKPANLRPANSSETTAAEAASAASASRRRLVSDFEFGETLGEGSYSTVVEATERATGRVYAAKILDKRHIIKEKKIKYVNIERDMLQALHHPFIVRLHYAFQDPHSLYFILDLAPNGELLAWIRRLNGLSLECARFYLAEIITAIEYMHGERTLHRDIKPENILLGSDMHILVTDFGTAKMFPAHGSGSDNESMRAYSFVGTAEYVSPELLTDKAADRNSDLWAIGCIAYQLLTGRPPFKGVNEYQTFQKVLKLDYTLPPAMAPQARDLVERILVLEPEKRLGATQRGGFRELKAHAFFQGFEWNGLESRTPPPMAGAPPAVPPKPAVLRQPPNTQQQQLQQQQQPPQQQQQQQQIPHLQLMQMQQMQMRGRGSSSDGFGTEKTSDSSFSPSPTASTDPLTTSPILPAAVAQLPAYGRNDLPAHGSNGGGAAVQSPSDYYTAASYRPPVNAAMAKIESGFNGLAEKNIYSVFEDEMVLSDNTDSFDLDRAVKSTLRLSKLNDKSKRKDGRRDESVVIKDSWSLPRDLKKSGKQGLVVSDESHNLRLIAEKLSGKDVGFSYPWAISSGSVKFKDGSKYVTDDTSVIYGYDDGDKKHMLLSSE